MRLLAIETNSLIYSQEIAKGDTNEKREICITPKNIYIEANLFYRLSNLRPDSITRKEGSSDWLGGRSISTKVPERGREKPA